MLWEFFARGFALSHRRFVLFPNMRRAFTICFVRRVYSVIFVPLAPYHICFLFFYYRRGRITRYRGVVGANCSWNIMKPGASLSLGKFFISAAGRQLCWPNKRRPARQLLLVLLLRVRTLVQTSKFVVGYHHFSLPSFEQMPSFPRFIIVRFTSLC